MRNKIEDADIFYAITVTFGVTVIVLRILVMILG